MIKPKIHPIIVLGISKHNIIKIIFEHIIIKIFFQGMDISVFLITKFIITIINIAVVMVVAIAAPTIPILYTNRAFSAMLSKVPIKRIYIGNLGFPVP